MRRMPLLVCIGAYITISALNASASCAPPAPYRCTLPTAPVAFSGTVIDVEQVNLRPRIPTSSDRSGRRRSGDPVPPQDNSYVVAKFHVGEVFRGQLDEVVVVRTDRHESSASYRFERGKQYLVFADIRDGYLYTDSCSGTRPTSTETALIRELRVARAGSPMSDVFGTVSLREADAEHFAPAQHVLITASSVSGEHRALTAVDGSYEFRGLTPGRYQIKVDPPPQRDVPGIYTLDVGTDGACRADFQLQYQGSISGTVNDFRGQPVLGTIGAQAVGVDENQGGFAAEVINGRFEVKSVPPGRYYLRVFPRLKGRSDGYYYPGTMSKAAAVEVEVGDGTTVTGVKFTLPVTIE